MSIKLAPKVKVVPGSARCNKFKFDASSQVLGARFIAVFVFMCPVYAVVTGNITSCKLQTLQRPWCACGLFDATRPLECSSASEKQLGSLNAHTHSILVFERTEL